MSLHVDVRRNVVQKLERWQEAQRVYAEVQQSTASAYSVHPSDEQQSVLEERLRLAGEALHHHMLILGDAWDEYDQCVLDSRKQTAA